MNRGNSSNCVHWLYAARTGTSTSMDFSIVAMAILPSNERLESKGATSMPGSSASRGKESCEERAHLGAVPLARAEGEAHRLAAGADDERGRQGRHPPGVGGALVGVEQDGECQAEARDVGLEQRARCAAVHRDTEHDEAAAAVLAPQRLQRRHLDSAWLTPRGPEVHEHELVGVLGEGGVAARQRTQAERRRAMPLSELDHARPLEGIEMRRVLGVMPTVFAR